MSKPEAKKPETEKTAGEEPAAEDAAEDVAEDGAEEEAEAPAEAAAEDAAEEEAEAPAEAAAEDAAETDSEAAEERDPEAEIADLNDKLLRALAETENLRRRARKEREDTANYAVSSFARDLLSVADNLGRALGALAENSAENRAENSAENPDAAADDSDGGLGSFIEGVRLTERELAAVFERHGIARVDPMGEKFDPNLHEAMFEIPTGDATPGTVVQVLEAGYVLKERLLRAAKVGVARALPEAEKGERVDTTA